MQITPELCAVSGYVQGYNNDVDHDGTITLNLPEEDIRFFETFVELYTRELKVATDAIREAAGLGDAKKILDLLGHDYVDFNPDFVGKLNDKDVLTNISEEWGPKLTLANHCKDVVGGTVELDVELVDRVLSMNDKTYFGLNEYPLTATKWIFQPERVGYMSKAFTAPLYGAKIYDAIAGEAGNDRDFLVRIHRIADYLEAYPLLFECYEKFKKICKGWPDRKSVV